MNEYEKLYVEIGALSARVVYLEQMLEATINMVNEIRNQPERLNPKTPKGDAIV